MSDNSIAIAFGIFVAWALFMFLLLFFSSVVYAFRRYQENRLARAETRRAFRAWLFQHIKQAVVSAFRSIASLRPERLAPDFSLWENPPAYRIALRHRCLKTRNRRIYVSDYSDGMSKGTLVSASQKTRERVPLVELETSPQSDRQFLENYDSLRQPTPPNPVPYGSDAEIYRFLRIGEMTATNSRIWMAGAFDHLTDKPALLGQRRSFLRAA